MVFYLIGATLTFGLLLSAFLKDESTSNSDLSSWIVVLVGSLLWFICLPSVIYKRVATVRRLLAPVFSGQTA
ncbi:hypothetical protein [Leptolyngbya sp. FACHB-711]|uniref:hypothetical protein n=1 Tax=unclassified Leptolyngbya TaxID=2650499 RepID=UPI00168686A2|nr:hypothetical protein [Leptolyngbya sp. FACHB-711]MBD1850454.1 hypothetical protein [Cyanobacteria bacterium FACHB-502]MBD2026044.1 hypothetical protein [Leptolyngbya sp. FACHB-711]